ncbi:Thiol-disulfide oxidoreductase resA [Delftia tsuruhatensis]|uniref:TlpA family protein disulfide reductase n=1 Tax=Delftia tsuruhatensis TaxID=180282 RepID=UPI001E76AB25|nr:TlpA disulfide reductase family protein [Delftia tsuruhatensis]CAB5668921.1 Thiol-disulfide oxidoreductase resA [Delftia tsuruhatensis]CAC9682688.1 Thiol-disulfide oxidoreductase resA [Delftia tsuruhatensis]
MPLRHLSGTLLQSCALLVASAAQVHAASLNALRLPPSLSLGPLTLPMGVVVAMLAWLLGQQLAAHSQKRSGQPVAALLWQCALAGLAAARLAYVTQWWSEYAPASRDWLELPAAVGRGLDIRDGGWNLWAGLLAALLWMLWQSRKSLALRRAAALPLGAGGAVLAVGALLQALPADDAPSLPAFTLVNAQARPISLRQLQQAEGRPMVINLWATWCPPCRREMPVLAQAQQQRPDVRFIWINQGESAETVTGYLRRTQTTAPLPPEQVLLDPRQQAGGHWRQQGLPSTYFYGADGRQCGMRMGELSRASLAEHLKDCS